MSLQVELCEHLAQDCLQAAERTKDPQTRELLLRHAVQWAQDALAELKQSRPAGARARDSSNAWNGRWWVHVRYCSTHCEALHEPERYDARAKHGRHEFIPRSSPQN